MITTYTTEEAAQIIGAPSERWLVQQLRVGRFRGRKVGRHWRMTEQDIEDAIEICVNSARRSAGDAVGPSSGLTRTSRKKLLRPLQHGR